MNCLLNKLQDERILIISNNVLSETNSNGKTILSCIDCFPKRNVRQLYFSSEEPLLNGYRYFRISDIDVMKGHFYITKRGSEKDPNSSLKNKKRAEMGKYSNSVRLIRELLWIGAWKSKALIQWLEDFSPTIIFFCGGDALFAHRIFQFVVKRQKVNSSIYITDDYIMPRSSETFVAKFRRNLIKKSMQRSIAVADNFFTISDVMRETYKKVFNKDSSIIVNMTESLLRQEIHPNNREITLIYAGSLYYGRERVIKKLVTAIRQYNMGSSKKAKLKVFTNNIQSQDVLSMLNEEGVSEYCGNAGKEKLIDEYNKADVLVFVESFELCNIEKTRYSLSTKIPEYLSLKKPILAIGPCEVGSIDYLKKFACCAFSEEDIYNKLEKILCDNDYSRDISIKAYNQYANELQKEKVQFRLWSEILKDKSDEKK